MGELAIILGNDFEAYRTDCIYYRDTPQNRKKVYDYLDERGFEYKQLVYADKENQENDAESWNSCIFELLFSKIRYNGNETRPQEIWTHHF